MKSAIATVFTAAILCCYVNAQISVSGIPSAVSGIVSSGKNAVFATTLTNRLYVSIDAGRTFIAVDTSDLLLEPWLSDIDFQAYRNPARVKAAFSNQGNYLWVVTSKGNVVCRYDMITAAWSTPYKYDSTCRGPMPQWQGANIWSIATDDRSVVAISVSTTSLLDQPCNYIAITYDNGDTWTQLPKMDQVSQYDNSVVSSMTFVADSSIVVFVYGNERHARGVYKYSLIDKSWSVSALQSKELLQVGSFGESVYAWTDSVLWRSVDYGMTFTEVQLPKGKIGNVSPWSESGPLVTLMNDSSTYVNVYHVVDGMTVEDEHYRCSSRPHFPFISSFVANDRHYLVHSGNDANFIIENPEDAPITYEFLPETYRVSRIAPIDNGMVAYVVAHGVYTIDSTGHAEYDSLTSFLIGGSPQQIIGSNDKRYIIQTSTQNFIVSPSGLDSMDRLDGSIMLEDPMLVGSKVYFGTKGYGIASASVENLDEIEYRLDSLPRPYDIDPEGRMTSSPAGVHNGALISLLSYTQSSPPFMTSRYGGIFRVAEKWERMNDSLLDGFRGFVNSGESGRPIFAFQAYANRTPNEYGAKRLYVFIPNEDRLVDATPILPTREYKDEVILNNEQIAFSSSYHDVIVFNLRQNSVEAIETGAMTVMSRLNEKLAVATLRNGLVIYDQSVSTAVDISPSTADHQPIIIWPLPCTDEVTLSLSISDEPVLEVDVYESSGQRVECESSVMAQEGKCVLVRIDTSALMSGLYMVLIRAQSNAYGVRIIVQ